MFSKNKKIILKFIKGNKYFIYFLGILALNFLFFPLIAIAADAGSIPYKYKPQVQIPDTDFGHELVTVNTGDLIGTYIVSLYQYGAGIAGLVALFMIVLAGWKWLMAAGNGEKINQAKDTIQGAVIGLFLLFGGYLLLSQISTRLVQFDQLNIVPPKFAEEACKSYEEQTTCEADSSCRWQILADPATGENIGKCILDIEACSSDGEVEAIRAAAKITIGANLDPRLMPEANDALQEVADSLNSGEDLMITSAYRTFERQQRLYDCYIHKVGPNCPSGCTSCNEAAEPSCTAPHQTGSAVDICIRNNAINTCTNGIMTEAYNCVGSNVPPCTSAINQAQTRLREIMTGAGFKPYSGEWWHFQL